MQQRLELPWYTICDSKNHFPWSLGSLYMYNWLFKKMEHEGSILAKLSILTVTMAGWLLENYQTFIKSVIRYLIVI